MSTILIIAITFVVIGLVLFIFSKSIGRASNRLNKKYAPWYANFDNTGLMDKLGIVVIAAGVVLAIVAVSKG